MGSMLANSRCVGCSSFPTSGSGSFGSLDCVDLIYFRVLSRFPLLVAIYLGRCLATAFDVRPGQEVKNLFWMALIHVAGTGLNVAACKYYMCSDLVVVWYALLHSGIFFVVLVFALVRGKRHNPVVSCHPQRRVFPSFLMCDVLEVNPAVHPASKNFPIEIRECCSSSGSMCLAHDCVGNWSNWVWHSCMARMAALLGMPMEIRGDLVLYGLCGALGCKNNFSGAGVYDASADGCG